MWVFSFRFRSLYPPGKSPPYQLEWALEPVRTTWRREKSRPYRDSNSDPSVVQLVTSSYTDWAIPAQGKAFLVTGRGYSYGSETSRLAHYLDNRLRDGVDFVSLTRRPPSPPQEDSWYSFLLEADSTPGHSAAGRIRSIENSSDLIGNQTRELPTGLKIVFINLLLNTLCQWLRECSTLFK
jgi:hypothetical protein